MAKDPYRFFRIEAHEILAELARGMLELDKKGPRPERIAELLRLSHTLKGAAHVVNLGVVAKLAHRMEGLLSPLRQADAAFPRATIEKIQTALDGIGVAVAAIDEPSQSDRSAAVERHNLGPSDHLIRTVRVLIDDLDALLEGISQIGSESAALRDDLEPIASLMSRVAGLAALTGVSTSASTLPRAEVANLADSLRDGLTSAHRALLGRVERIERELLELRRDVDRIRLVPVETVFAAVERAVRDTAASLDRRVELVATGGEVRLDAHVLSGLRGALLHLVRNAVAHGIESESERRLHEKPPHGTISLTVEQRGYRVLIRCHDDGRGVDFERVRRAHAERAGLDDGAARRLTPDQLCKALLGGGLTTVEAATEIAGRGVGLDAVRASVEQLKGEVRLESQPEHGTAIEISVPISLAALPALRVEAADIPAVIPLDAILSTTRIRSADRIRSSTGESLALDGQVIPFIPMREALGRAAGGETDQSRAAVIVQMSGRRAAVGVDRLGGVERVIVRKLPPAARVDAVVAGAALDRRGVPQLVMSPDALVESAVARRALGRAPEQQTRPPILVIDDSLTTRMLEQSILEAAGYEVDLAVSGEEGLRKAHERSYGLFIVDVEMPGMDGFEFVSRTRSDRQLSDVPSIIVTSRADPDDRRRGKEAGARAYIVKSEFEQGALLDAIRRLTG